MNSFFNNLFGKHKAVSETINALHSIDSLDLPVSKKLDGFMLILEDSEFNSEDIYLLRKRKAIASVIRKALGAVLIFVSAYLIFLPQPKEIEIMTIYYFNPNDGICISDIVALFILSGGIYLISRK